MEFTSPASIAPSKGGLALNAEPAAGPAMPAPEARSVVRAAAPESSADDAAETPADGADAAMFADCRADAILARAGIAPLPPPGPAEPRYTFPEELLQREDIFYDYGLIVPVEECGPLAAQITGRDGRSLTAVQAIASEVLAVLRYIDGLNLAGALGERPDGTSIAEALRQDINDFLATVNVATSSRDLQNWKRRMSEWATFARDAARRRLFLASLQSQDPHALLNDLGSALANIPPFRLYQEDEINYGEIPEGRAVTSRESALL